MLGIAFKHVGMRLFLPFFWPVLARLRPIANAGNIAGICTATHRTIIVVALTTLPSARDFQFLDNTLTRYIGNIFQERAGTRSTVTKPLKK